MVREAIIEALSGEQKGLRVCELRDRVDDLIRDPVAPLRFKGYVNELSLNKKPLLERLGYGRYRLRS